MTVLSGCTSAPSTETSPLPTHASPTAPDITPRIVATGTISSPDGITAGSVVISYTSAGTFEFALSDYRTTRLGAVQLVMNPRALGPAETCLDTGFRVTMGSLSGEGRQSFHLGDMQEIASGDPRFLGEIVLTQRIPADVENDCAATVIASGPIRWTMPDVRPHLIVRDTGAQSGATGTVALDAAGVPLTYTVATADIMQTIAARLGITTDDVFYLNPRRIPQPRAPLAYPGEIFNLAKSAR